MRSRPSEPRGNEYAWGGKGPGFESDNLFFFFQTKYCVSN